MLPFDYNYKTSQQSQYHEIDTIKYRIPNLVDVNALIKINSILLTRLDAHCMSIFVNVV